MTDETSNAYEIWDIDRLQPFATNPREISEEAVAKVAASIKAYGFRNPVQVLETGEIVAGHTRTLAAKKLGLSQVPVLILHGITEEQARALRIADNKTGEFSSWNMDLLGAEVRDLDAKGIDLDALGFSPLEISDLLQSKAEQMAEADEPAPDPPKEPLTQLGDLWLIGSDKGVSRLMCGSSTSPTDVDTLMSGAPWPHLMVTDPPYGVEYDPAWRVKAGIGGEGTATGKVLNDDKADWREAWALFPGDVAYVWHGALHHDDVTASLRACGFQVRSQIVWVKGRFALSRGHYHWQHEPAYVAVREGKDDHWAAEHDLAAYAVKDDGASGWLGSRKQSTVWNIDMVQNTTGHGTQKPVDCMRRPMLNNSRRGDCVYEPFSGSGTTLVAAQMEGRVCLAMELSPAYVDVALIRFHNLFPDVPMVRANDGKSFDEVFGHLDTVSKPLEAA